MLVSCTDKKNPVILSEQCLTGHIFVPTKTQFKNEPITEVFSQTNTSVGGTAGIIL